jgi:hypothetical protein
MLEQAHQANLSAVNQAVTHYSGSAVTFRLVNISG